MPLTSRPSRAQSVGKVRKGGEAAAGEDPEKRGAGEGEERTSDALPQMYTGSSSERLPHEQVEEPTGDALPQMYPGGSAVRLPREQVDSAARRRRVRLVFAPDHRGA